jgi:hypothetical protein
LSPKRGKRGLTVGNGITNTRKRKTMKWIGPHLKEVKEDLPIRKRRTTKRITAIE